VVVIETLCLGVAGTATSTALWRASRRFAVRDRLQSASSRLVRPAALRRWLVRALDRAAIDTTPEHALQTWGLALLIAVVLGVGLGPTTGLLLLFGVALGGPVWLHANRHRRARAATTAIPEFLDQTASELRAGGTIATAIARRAHGDSALAGDLAMIEARTQLGATMTDSLGAWAKTRATPSAHAAAGALSLSSTVGGRSADALEGLATSLRERLAIVAETRALSAQGRYSAFVVGLGPLAYLAVSTMLDRRAASALVGTPVGRVCAVVGIGLEIAGALWMRRVVRSAERFA
jgi:tight adherence protein B